MSALKICMVAVLGLFALSVLKQWKSDLSPLLRVGLTVLLGGIALGMLTPVIGYAEKLLGSQNTRYAEILLKALGIAFLTHYASEICRESGESGLASNVETVGKIEILLLCLPLLDELLTAAERLLTLGG